MTITIRLATPDDLDELHPMSARLARHLGDAPRTPEMLARDAFILPGMRALIARDGDVVGYVMMRLTRDPITWRAGYEIAELFVAEGHRGRGIGRRLVGAARLLAQAEGRSTLSVAPQMAALTGQMRVIRAMPMELA